MAATYEAIATTTLGSATSSYTFSSIPSTYTDLVLVASSKLSAADDYIKLRFNGDTATNYSDIQMMATTSGIDYSKDNNQTACYVGYINSTEFSPLIINIYNYANATTYKTLTTRNGSTTRIQGIAGLWRKTPEAINSVTILTSSGNFVTNSTFTLYGIKAA